MPCLAIDNKRYHAYSIDKIFLGLRHAPMLDSLVKTQLNIMACDTVDSNGYRNPITGEIINL